MAITLFALLGLIALWWALRFLPAGVDRHRPLPYLIAFVRFLWIPSLVIAGVALLSHHWIIAVLATILTALTGIFASPWYRKSQNVPAARDQTQQPLQDKGNRDNGTAYTVMTLNCRYGRADPKAIVAAARSNDVSILALQELSRDLVAELKQAGIGSLLPYCQLGKAQESDNGGFNGIWTRAQPDIQTESTIDIAAAEVPHCEVNGIAIYSAHPKSPMRGCKEWSHGIISLGTFCQQTSNSLDISSTEKSDDGSAVVDKISQSNSTTTASAPEAIVMGDLNSNLDHPSFRKLLDSGFQDAGLGASHRDAASFPQWLPWPRLELDHILVTSGLSTANVRTLVIPGSDHLALLAQLHRA
ncbi:endonuclease/exonuclease/phosphatase family protein [Bifidobacterium sp. ESL0682]|uniref:endonuclease/exonuclease/phosphatase family protein n=1 Tax=Bifidobacterium sp. ESL0682 TaxID=2983212 RepID=UPI0023F6AB67|nr:endonuclease/exonuclease/phosphatase family protein [Bifidobacterium sp. ESL0682]WEV41791.1 endonuclease/exonuclease/phosphatase family protein [Bifidobacterium sp. ESL0682]